MNSFSLVSKLRGMSGVRKVGHTGTLDRMAAGVMVILVGRENTRKAKEMILERKTYWLRCRLGIATNTYDQEGFVTDTSEYMPTLSAVEKAIDSFQGKQWQLPPMHSAIKVKGKKLWQYAKQGKRVERSPREVDLSLTLLSYSYPHLEISVNCSAGTYMRTLTDDLGMALQCNAYMHTLVRTRCGEVTLDMCYHLSR